MWDLASICQPFAENRKQGLPTPKADAKRPPHPLEPTGFSRQSGRSSGVEHNLAKVGVEGSNPFARSIVVCATLFPKLSDGAIEIRFKSGFSPADSATRFGSGIRALRGEFLKGYVNHHDGRSPCRARSDCCLHRDSTRTSLPDCLFGASLRSFGISWSGAQKQTGSMSGRPSNLKHSVVTIAEETCRSSRTMPVCPCR